MRIDWSYPEPRRGALGQWDAFVGPGATNAEEWLQLGLGALIALICIVQFTIAGAADVAWYHYAIVVFLALDIGGGIVTNAASSAKRWYHRNGYPKWKHLMFLVMHALHLSVVSILFAGDPFLYFGLTFGGLMFFGPIIVSVPLYLQRPTAFGLATVAIVIVQFSFFSIPGLQWFLPLIVLKLLIGHLVKEAPFRPEVTK